MKVGWKHKRLKFAASYFVSNVDKHSEKDELPVRLCNYTDVYYNERIHPRMELMRATASLVEIEKFRLEKGDVIITKDSEEWQDIAVPALVEESAPDLICGYHLAVVRPEKRSLIGEFLLRAFQSGAINHQFRVASNGVTRYGLPKEAIGSAVLPIPPLGEQLRIAAFLDGKLGRLDDLMRKKERQLALLAEKRRALISHAVTRGLTPKTKTKFSGISWLGDIPLHWQVKRVKYLATKIGSGKTPLGGSSVYLTEGVMFLRSQNVYEGGLRLDDVVYISEAIDEELATSRVEANDILLNITGASIGRVCKFPEGMPKANVNQHVCIVRPDRAFSPNYLTAALQSHFTKHQIFAGETGTSREGLNFEQVGNIVVAGPFHDLAEQKAIATLLERNLAALAGAVTKLTSQLAKLLEYRQTLITAAVTGQIAIPEAAA